jgi:hypothetical protein
VSAGTLPTWLGLTIPTSTTTPILNFSVSPIPNSALANSSTTVNAQSCALGGTCTIPAVTGFSSGNLPPLFTISVATSTSTPALTFTASTAAQNSVLAGPATGGTGAYSFRALVAADIPALAYIPTTSAPAGTIVGTTDTQTLSNKTLAPTTIINGDTTTTPSTLQQITSTNTGSTAGIPVGYGCAIVHTFVSGSNYAGQALCVDTSGNTHFYASSSHALGSESWNVLWSTSGSLFSVASIAASISVQSPSYSGTGTATFAAGAAAGTSPTVACTTSHICDNFSGEVTLTTGTGTGIGTLLTITLPTTRTNVPNCNVTVSTTGVGALTTDQWTETTSTIVITANVALTSSTVYTVRYMCGGR